MSEYDYDHEYPLEGIPDAKGVPVRRTVPHQFCGECGCNTCYSDDYLCSACRESMDGSANGRQATVNKCMWAQEGECGVDGCEGCQNGGAGKKVYDCCVCGGAVGESYVCAECAHSRRLARGY